MIDYEKRLEDLQRGKIRFKYYCENCGWIEPEWTYKEHVEAEYDINGENIKVDGDVLFCSKCNEHIGNVPLDDALLLKAYKIYHKRHKAALISVPPKACYLISTGRKTMLLLKKKPQVTLPMKWYIYQTKNGTINTVTRDGDYWRVGKELISCNNTITLYPDYDCGKVIGEFVCDKIEQIYQGEYGLYMLEDKQLDELSMSYTEVSEFGEGQYLYGLHISDLKIYDTPKEIIEFEYYCKKRFNIENCYDCKNAWIGTIAGSKPYCDKVVTSAPSSWCYVEELK